MRKAVELFLVGLLIVIMLGVACSRNLGGKATETGSPKIMLQGINQQTMTGIITVNGKVGNLVLNRPQTIDGVTFKMTDLSIKAGTITVLVNNAQTMTLIAGQSQALGASLPAPQQPPQETALPSSSATTATSPQTQTEPVLAYQKAEVSGSFYSTNPSSFTLAQDITFLSPIDRLTYQEYPLAINAPVSTFTLSGDITLDTDYSDVRVIMMDSSGDEYLVFEASPLLYAEKQFSMLKTCEETCFLEQKLPTKIRVEGQGVTIHISSISYSDKSIATPAAQQELLDASQESAKIETMNKNLKRMGLPWVAGETEISKKPYQEQKKLIGAVEDRGPAMPNMQGALYYTEGILVIQPLSDEEESSDEEILDGITGQFTLILPPPPKVIPDLWDWRNMHGENWMTPPKTQQCGSCWAYAAADATEGLINVYFNQHLPTDLSEQELISCCEDCWSKSGCKGGYPSKALEYVKEMGIVEDYCFVDKGSDAEGCEWQGDEKCEGEKILCDQKCQNPSESVTIHDIQQWDPRSAGKLKAMLIKNGPITGGLRPWNHAMTMAGFGTVTKPMLSELMWDRGMEKPEISSLLGKTFWIFKNSWGVYGDDGYVYVMVSTEQIDWVSAPLLPESTNGYKILCSDKDLDTYCNWGVSEQKPDVCSSACAETKDYDDSNPYVHTLYELANFECGCTDVNFDNKVDSADKVLVRDIFKGLRYPTYMDIDGNGEIGNDVDVFCVARDQGKDWDNSLDLRLRCSMCRDSDDNAGCKEGTMCNDPLVKGEVHAPELDFMYDDCVDESTLREFFCPIEETYIYSHEDIDCRTLGEAYRCSEGACILKNVGGGIGPG